MSDESDRRTEYERLDEENDRKAKLVFGGIFLLVGGGTLIAFLAGGWEGLRIAFGILCGAIAIIAVGGFLGAVSMGGTSKETAAGCVGVCLSVIVAILFGVISAGLLFGI